MTDTALEDRYCPKCKSDWSLLYKALYQQEGCQAYLDAVQVINECRACQKHFDLILPWEEE